MIKKQQIKEEDLLLLSHLRKNARVTLTQLSKETKIPISTIHDKLKHQEIIQKNICLLDYALLGFSTQVHIFLKVGKEDKDKLIDYLLDHFNVNTIAKVNSGFDFLIEGIFRNIKDIEDFVEDLELAYKIKAKQVFYIIYEITKEQFFTNPDRVIGMGVEK